MPQFTYQPSQVPDIATIASLIARQNEPYARSAENIATIQGQTARANADLWGRAIQGISSGVENAIATATDPRRKIEAAQLDELNQKRSDLLAFDKAFSQPGGRDAILSALSGHLRPAVQKQFADADESAAKVQEAQLGAEKATTAYVNTLADNIEAHNFDPVAAQAAISHAKTTFANNPSLLSQVGQFEQAIHSNPTADGVKAVVGPILDLKKKAEEDKAKGLKYSPGEVSPILGSTPPAGPKVEVIPPGATAAVSAQNAQGQPTVSPLFTAPEKTVKPLDQQLLEAIAGGDNAKRDNILATLKADANAKRDPVAMAQLEAIRSLSQQAAQQRIDEANPQSDKNQQKFEQEYRTVLQRGMSSRSGGVGLEDAKVQQANHLLSGFEQFYDPKTGEWNIPRVQLNEFALGLANLTAPKSAAGEAMLKEFQQRTAKGDLAGALTYLTGQPVAANTQGITQMLKESIERQGRTAEQNREGEMSYLRNLAPTDLNDARRLKLESVSLNPLRQSRIAVDDKGNRRLFVSIDGGKTWK